MDILKKFFPFSFTTKNDVAALVINIIIHIVACVLVGVVIGLLCLIPVPVIWTLAGIIGGLVELYAIIGIVLSCLDYFKILK